MIPFRRSSTDTRLPTSMNICEPPIFHARRLTVTISSRAMSPSAIRAKATYEVISLTRLAGSIRRSGSCSAKIRPVWKSWSSQDSALSFTGLAAVAETANPRAARAAGKRHRRPVRRFILTSTFASRIVVLCRVLAPSLDDHPGIAHAGRVQPLQHAIRLVRPGQGPDTDPMDYPVLRSRSTGPTPGRDAGAPRTCTPSSALRSLGVGSDLNEVPQRLRHDAGRRSRTALPVEFDRPDLHRTRAGVRNPQLDRGRVGEIDDAARVERAPVIDSQYGAASVLEMGHPDVGGKRQALDERPSSRTCRRVLGCW